VQPRMRAMFFVDGENLVSRYQAMVGEGFTPRSSVAHEQDRFVWSFNIAFPRDCRVLRAYYYTSVTGDDDSVQAVADRIKGLRVCRGQGGVNTLYPVVFKKPKNQVKAKGVDIRMTVDILIHVYQDDIDALCLFSGDGDYIPVLNEALRRGKRIFVASLSNGLNPSLRRFADDFIDLDPTYFDPTDT
jgi:uncharacterized LabA/DUF88 family protein